MSRKYLAPFAFLYQRIMSARNYLYDCQILTAHRESLPVICVGNAVVGGGGKTPFAQFLANLLLSNGRVPGLVSRGYGGQLRGPYLVQQEDGASLVGDEVVLHRAVLPRKIQVVVARKRYRGVALLAEAGIADVVLLDDGFQHRALERQVNLLLVDSRDISEKGLYYNEPLLPVGRLRESIDEAVARASCLVVVHRVWTEHEREQASAVGTVAREAGSGRGLVQFDFFLSPGPIVDVARGEVLSPEEAKGMEMIAVGAIANNEGFFRLLESLGIVAIEKFSFRDHHEYSESDWQQLTKSGRPIACTAKDAVKLRRFVPEPRQLWVFNLEGKMQGEAEEEKFLLWLRPRIAFQSLS